MPFLSTEQQDAIRASVTTPSITSESLADVYRSPAASGGKTGARALVASAVPCRLRPGGQDDSNYRPVVVANPVNASRVSQMAKFAVGADVRTGDELRIDGARYLVEGVGEWTNALMAALSEVRGAA